MADTDTYPGVDQDEEQKRKGYNYPGAITPPVPDAAQAPVVPMPSQVPTDAPAPAPSTSPAPPAPSASPTPVAMTREPGSNLVRRGDAMAATLAGGPAPSASPPVPPGPPPTWSQYAPPAPTGINKLGHALMRFVGPLNEEYNIQPQQRAAAAYGAATKEHDTEVAEQQKAQEAGLKAKEDELVDVTLPDGTKTQVMRKNLATPTTALITGASREAVADTGAASRKDVAQTGKEAKVDVASIEAGKAKYTDLDINGKKVPGKVDAQGNLQLADGTPAPKGTTEYKAPTYAEVMGGRLTNILIDGVPTQVQLQPQGGIKVIGESGTGALAGRVGQAKIVESAGDQLIKDIEANKGKLGNMQAMVSAALLGTPWSDPETQQLYSEIGSYIALHPAMHGFRGTNALDHFSRLIGGIPNNPDAMIAGIRGLTKMANIFTEPTASGSAAGGGNAPKGATDEVVKDGKVIGHVVTENRKKVYKALERVQ